MSSKLSAKLCTVRVVAVALGLCAWFGTQKLIAARPFAESGVGDKIFDLTAGLNAALVSDPERANLLLILSSAVIDIVGCFLLSSAIFGRSIRPFLGLLILFGLRQICQGLIALPLPPGMIWNDPGFPSLLVTYGTATDLFFSGHTALAFYGALEISRYEGKIYKLIGLLIAVFEASTVLVLRAHYTMDVYAGAITALWVSGFIDRVAARVDALLEGV